MNRQFIKSRRLLAASGLLFVTAQLAAGGLPGPSVRIRPQRAFPGDTVSLLISRPQLPDPFTCRFNGHDLLVYKISKDRWRALIGIPANLAPGSYPLQIGRPDEKPQTVFLVVKPRRFPFESIAFTPNQQRLLSVGQGESKKIHRLMAVETSQQLWKGTFRLPVPGRLITRYGTRRTYEDFHRGVDLECPTGLVIRAPEAGRVVLAEKFKLHGNSILIDHGQGVMSIYLHLSEFLVKKGQAVQKDEPIGKVGNSGLSTAPHLHWGVYVHSVPVDPLTWTKRKF